MKVDKTDTFVYQRQPNDPYEDEKEQAIGEYLHDLRIKHKMTLRQVAAMVGVSHTQIHQIERGDRRPSGKLLDAFATAFQMDRNSLRFVAGFPEDHSSVIPAEAVQWAFNAILDDSRCRALTPFRSGADWAVMGYAVELYRRFSGRCLLEEQERHYVNQWLGIGQSSADCTQSKVLFFKEAHSVMHRFWNEETPTNEWLPFKQFVELFWNQVRPQLCQQRWEPPADAHGEGNNADGEQPAFAFSV